MQVYHIEPVGAAEWPVLGQIPTPGFPGDPIAAYGKSGAAWIMSTIHEVPQPERKLALKALLTSIDTELWENVTNKATKNRAKGMGPKQALQKALAASLANGLSQDLIETGRGKTPGPHSQLGLGMYDDSVDIAFRRAAQALGAWYNPVDAIKTVGGAIKTAGKKIGSAAEWTAGKTWDGTKWVAKKGYAGAGTTVGWVGTGLSKLGSLACAVVNSPIAIPAAAGAATAAGAPPQAGAGGAFMAQKICGKNEPPATQTDLMTGYRVAGVPLMPVLLIGGAVLAIVLITKK